MTRQYVRSKNQVKSKFYCDTLELREFITLWTETGRWRYENFADFLELIGLKFPVYICDFNNQENTFKCFSKKSELEISFDFDKHYGIYVTKGEETVLYRANCKWGNVSPTLSLQIRIIKKDGKRLMNFYSSAFCNRELELNEKRVLRIDIGEPSKATYNKSDALVLRKTKEVEDYLLTLDTSLVLRDVYHKVIDILGFSGEDISRCGKIHFCYIEVAENEEIVIEEIFQDKPKTYMSFSIK